jgi:putative oxidoreductase
VDEGFEAAALGFRFVLALVFLSAAIPKLLAPADFALAVRNYRLLPPRLNAPVARWLPRLELALALALLAGVAIRAAAALALTALLVFAGAIAISLARGRQIDCGCHSAASPRAIGWWLVGRDLFLAIGALLILVAAPKTLAVANLWSDPAAQLGVGDGVAIAVVAAIVVLVELLADEALRVKRAARSFALRSAESAS